MIDRRDISYTEGTPGSPHIAGQLLQTPAVPEIAAMPKGAVISSTRPIPGPSPIDIATDLTLATLGPIGWVGAGVLNRDKPPHMQLPTGQVGEAILSGMPAYGAYNSFVDKPEGGISEILDMGGGLGMIPKLPEGDGGVLAPFLSGDSSIFNIDLAGGGLLPKLDLGGIKTGLILAGLAIGGLYLAGKHMGKK